MIIGIIYFLSSSVTQSEYSQGYIDRYRYTIFLDYKMYLHFPPKFGRVHLIVQM